jgi:large subunit ribosomal protein L1
MSQVAQKLNKRQQAWGDLGDSTKNFDAIDALNKVKKNATAKFDESIDVAVNLGIDAKKSDQTVRG